MESKRIRWLVVVALAIASLYLLAAMLLLSSLPPEVLVEAQFIRVDKAGYPIEYSGIPRWVSDLHWKVSGMDQAEEANRRDSSMVRVIVGAKLQADEEKTEVDERRFRIVLRHFVCGAPARVHLDSGLVHLRRTGRAPFYEEALRSCVPP